MFYDKTFSEVSVDSGIEIGRPPRIHFGRMVVRDKSEEGSYEKMLHRPYSTGIGSVSIFESQKDDVSGLKKYLGIVVDKNTMVNYPRLKFAGIPKG